MSLRRQNLLQFLLIFTFTCAHADELTSTVQVFNAIKWVAVQEKAKNDNQVSSLKALVEIIYDPMVGRRWEREAYFETINERWVAFRSHFCPSKLMLCSLPATVRDFSQIDQLIENLISDHDHAILNKELLDTGLQLTENLNFPGITGNDERANFSLRIAEIDERAKYKQLQLSGIKAKKLTRLISLENAVLYDLRSYELGFTQKSVPAYYAVDKHHNGYLQIEKIKMAAMDFAVNWRRNINNPAPYTVINAEEILLQRLYAASEQMFAETFKILFQRLQPSHLEDIERFKLEQSKGRYPLEVYQFVAYEHLLKLATQQVEFYQWASQIRKSKDEDSIATESLLNLQKNADRNLFLYLIHRLAVVGDAAILDQTISQKSAQRYLVKIIEVLRGQGKYLGSRDLFPVLSKKVDYGLLLDSKFLLSQQPHLFNRLDEKKLLSADQLRSAPVDVQRSVIDGLVSTPSKNGQSSPFLTGILRLAGAIFLGADQETLDIYATQIFDVNMTDGEL